MRMRMPASWQSPHISYMLHSSRAHAQSVKSFAMTLARSLSFALRGPLAACELRHTNAITSERSLSRTSHETILTGMRPPHEGVMADDRCESVCAVFVPH